MNIELEIESKLLSKKMFSSQVEYMMLDKRIPPIEACLLVCEENQLDPSEVNRLVSAQLKAKIEAEAMISGLIPRVNVLPGME